MCDLEKKGVMGIQDQFVGVFKVLGRCEANCINCKTVMLNTELM